MNGYSNLNDKFDYISLIFMLDYVNNVLLY